MKKKNADLKSNAPIGKDTTLCSLREPDLKRLARGARPMGCSGRFARTAAMVVKRRRTAQPEKLVAVPQWERCPETNAFVRHQEKQTIREETAIIALKAMLWLLAKSLFFAKKTTVPT